MDEFRQHIKANRWLYGTGGTVLVVFFIWGIVAAFSASTGNGVLTITAPRIGAQVFIDEEERRPFDQEGFIGHFRTAAGERNVIVFVEGFLPWTLDVSVAAGQTIALKPFMVPQNPSGSFITSHDPDYTRLLGLVHSVAPSRARPVRSDDGLVEAFVDGDSVIARWSGEDTATRPDFFCRGSEECADELVVFEFDTTIRSLDFYRDRNDVFLVAAGVGVFAFDADTRGTQNFQPLYRGVAPTMTVEDETTLALFDADALRIINY